jgi:outer membrane lipoprotein LolB
MKVSTVARTAGLALLLLLSACVQQPVRRAPDADLLKQQTDREARLATHPDWSLSGRIAISDSSNGGSGRIDWTQHGNDFDIRLSAPVTRQSWRIVRESGHVRLEGLEGGTREGDDAQALLQQALGWVVPIDSLAAWARGVRTSANASLQFGADGLPALLTEGDWSVEYRAWDEALSPQLPSKIFASQGDSKVRLSVDHWDTK